MNALRRYFEEAARHPRLLSEEDLRHFVAALAADGIGLKNPVRKNVRMAGKWIAVVVGAAVLLGSAFLYVRLATGPFDGGGLMRATERTAGRSKVMEGHSCPLGEFVGISDHGRSDVAAASLQALPMLVLSPDELARIGILKHHDDGITLYHHRSGADAVGRDELRSDECGFPKLAFSAPDGVTPLPFTPRLITDDLGRLRRFYYSYDEIDPALQDSIIKVQQRYSYLSDGGRVKEAVDSMQSHPRFNAWFAELHERSRSLIDFDALVPVLIRSARRYTSADSLNGNCRPDIIVWFDRTPEFLALLPSDWSSRMAAYDGRRMDERKSISTQSEARPDRQRDAGTKSMPEHREVVMSQNPKQGTNGASHPSDEHIESSTSGRPGPGAGEPGLRVNPGTVRELAMLPNPVENIGVVRLTLDEPRTVAVSLHGIMGNRLTVLASDVRFEAGEWLMEINVERIPSGIYLLAVSTDRGELSMVRAVVR